MTALWTWLVEWALTRTRMFWYALTFGGFCFVAGCKVSEHLPHWFF